MSDSNEIQTPTRKAATALAGVVVIGILGYMISDMLPANASEKQSNQQVQANPFPLPPPAPTINETPLRITPEIQKIITYSEQAMSQSIRAAMLKSKSDADKFDNTQPPVSSIDTLDNLNINYDNVIAPSVPIPSMIDAIAISGIFENSKGVNGFVTINNELIPIKKGAKIGKVAVVKMTADYVTFSDGNRTVTRWVNSQIQQIPKKEGSDE